MNFQMMKKKKINWFLNTKIFLFAKKQKYLSNNTQFTIRGYFPPALEALALLLLARSLQDGD